MSVSRTRFILGLQPRLVLAARAGPALAARRLISSSSCTGAQHHHHHREPLESLTSNIDQRHMPSAPLDPDAQLAAYRDGPSALDKAVHLFFFTEIIRGNYPAALSLPLCCAGELTYSLVHAHRHVDRAGELFPPPVHHHVPVREGPSVAPFPRRACPAEVPQWRGAVHRCVNSPGVCSRAIYAVLNWM